jgi:hypothetical protein
MRQRINGDRLKIHFSALPGLEPLIKNGFKGTTHQVSFGRITSEVINNNDLVVPLDVGTIIQLNNDRLQLREDLIPLPSKQSVLLLDDKLHFNAYMSKAGFAEFIPAQHGRNLPLVVKKKFGAFSDGVFVCNNDKQLALCEPLLNTSDYFAQALVPGRVEFATHLIIRKQKIRAHLNVKYLFQTETPIKGKDKSIQYPAQTKHLGLFEKMLNEVEFSGICCVNYKEVNGKPQILEINPRFGGSLCRYFPTMVRQLTMAY